MKTNITLIGFMGTGKTAVGKILARKLKMDFIEMDALIEMRAKMTIPQIFEQGGEIAFRELEIEVTKELIREKRSVIACGGGFVLNRINVDRISQGSLIVYLSASPSVTLKRVSKQTGQRPLLEVQDPLSTIREMIKKRKPYYEQAADITINTSKLSTEAVANVIIEKLKENENIDWSE
jgi:shikimate kinase